VTSLWARTPINPARVEHLSGVKKAKDSKSEWDSRYSSRSYIYGKSPAKFLSENYDYIPFGGSVLDMGVGEGRNAVFLAQKGYHVTGIDISSVAVKKANLFAQEVGVKIKTIVASLNKYKIPPESYDAIICFYYVDRSLINEMKKWIKPGGLIFFEAYTELQEKVKGFDKADNTLIAPQELLTMFGKDFQILKFEEPLHHQEFRSSIIVRKK
jgi:2-polyprenyl-3-methyl-5-hydroxy-6-metoxy-1,4-benzoquinol methylase